MRFTFGFTPYSAGEELCLLLGFDDAATRPGLASDTGCILFTFGLFWFTYACTVFGLTHGAADAGVAGTSCGSPWFSTPLNSGS